MGDIFEGFRWREVFTVLTITATGVGFFLLVVIDAMRDMQAHIDGQLLYVRERVRTLERDNATLQAEREVQRILRICAERPQVCEDR